MAYAKLTGDASSSLWAYLSLIGAPVSLVAYPVGFALLFSGPNRKVSKHSSSSPQG
jgi:hypothetical protein